MPEYRLAEIRDGRARWDSATTVAAPRLTRRQHAILTYIRAHLCATGYPPTVRQIADAVGLASSASVTYQLGRLEHKGALDRWRHRTRGLRVTDPAPAVDTRADRGVLYLIHGGKP